MNTDKMEIYKQYFEKHMHALLLASQSYDKAILSLSTATLGFTFAFIKLIGCINHNCLLIFIWFFLILSILFVLSSFLMDQSHTEHKIKYYYWCITKDGSEVKEPHWTDAWMLPSSVLAGVFFVIGITLFTIFVGISI